MNIVQRIASKIAIYKCKYMNKEHGCKLTRSLYRDYKNEELSFMKNMTMDEIMDYKDWSLDLPRRNAMLKTKPSNYFTPNN